VFSTVEVDKFWGPFLLLRWLLGYSLLRIEGPGSTFEDPPPEQGTHIAPEMVVHGSFFFRIRFPIEAGSCERIIIFQT